MRPKQPTTAYISKEPNLPRSETETVARIPAKIGPRPFAALPPRLERPFIVALCVVGTVRLVITEILVKKVKEKIRCAANRQAKNKTVANFNSPASALVFSRSDIGTKNISGAENILPIRTAPTSLYLSYTCE
jgi:hypothetical protein